jgi:hypothetical protein
MKAESLNDTGRTRRKPSIATNVQQFCAQESDVPWQDYSDRNSIRFDWTRFRYCAVLWERKKNWWSVKVIVLYDVTPYNLADMSTSLQRFATCMTKVHGDISYKTNFNSNLLFCRILVRISKIVQDFQFNWPGILLRKCQEMHHFASLST